MTISPLRRSTILTLPLLLIWAGLSSPAQAQGADPCAGLPEWRLFLNGEPADELVERIRGNEVAFLSAPPPAGLGIDLGIEELRDILQQIDEAPTRVLDVTMPVQLQGVAGFSTTLFLKKLLLGVHPVVYGKIRDYIFSDKTKSGHLSVDMCIDRSEFYHWDIEILEDGFDIAEREDSPSDPRKPFRNVDLVLPEAATDPSNPMSIWARGLDHKLHARGTRIEVRDIYHRSLSSPDLIRLDPDHHLYDITEASCVDLFTQGRPPASFGELTDSDYCLGRCEHPAIVNTGG